MNCPNCGEKVPAGLERCETCGALTAPPGEDCPAPEGAPERSPGDRRNRLVTSLVDRPADPGMIDEMPPASAARGIPDIAASGEGGHSERRSFAGDRLEEDAPVTPGEVRPPGPAGATQTRETDLNEKPQQPKGPETAAEHGPAVADFGEAREAAGASASGAAGGTGATWGYQWETELRQQVFGATAPLLPKGGFWIRLAAAWIDGLFLSIIGSITFAALFSSTGIQEVVLANLAMLESDPAAAMEALRPALEPHLGVIAITYVGISLVFFLYYPVCHAAWGRTLGKVIFGLRVVRADGKPLRFGRAFLRYVGYIMSLIPFALGLIWAAWDSQKQGWHDKLAGTYVIKERG